MVTQEKLRELLHYDPESGTLTWIRGRPSIKRGATAGSIRPDGYVSVGFGGKTYFAHRLAWLWMTGSWPAYQIDHINRIPSDNRWANLRLASHGQNVVNTVRRKSRIGLPRGVSPQSRGGKGFIAKLWLNKSEGWRCLGTYTTPDEAHRVYLAAAREYRGEFFPL